MADSMLVPFPIRSDKFSCQVFAEQHLAHVVSPFQTIDIYSTTSFGRMLFLDGHVQLSGLDEHAYHESLVHVPALSVPKLRTALVVGAGDGGVLRELCLYSSVERIDMVEIDQAVIETCQTFMPELGKGAFDDPRVHLTVGDAFEFVRTASGPYDLVVLDATDVYEEVDGELSEQLWTEGFYRDCFRLLSPEGFVVTQADNHVFCPYSLKTALAAFSSVFPAVGWYQAIVPSFGGFSAFAWASRGATPAKEMPSNGLPLRYLNPVTWKLAFTNLGFSLESGS